MAGEWDSGPLDELVEDIVDRRGITPLKLGAVFVPAGYRVISAKAIKSRRVDLSADDPRFVDEATYRKWMRTPLLADDVILTSEAPLGEVAYVRESVEWCLGQRLFAIRTKKSRLHGRFLYYALQSEEVRRDLLSRATGTTAQGIRQSELRRIRIPLPEVVEQRAIARILGALDDKIELNQRMNETLEAVARALFKSWFVDFGPVRAKAEGHDTGLPKSIAALFPDSFQDSVLGEIPAAWSVGPILNHASLISGGTPKTDRPEYWNGDIQWASAKDVSQCGEAFLIETERSITGQGLHESATQVVAAFCSVVVARGATTGRMVLFGRKMAMNQTCYALASTTATPFALYCELRLAIYNLVHAAHGSVFDTITTNTFATSQVVLAPERVLKAFETRVAPLFHRMLVGIETSRSLAALSETLLPKLISGELRVKDAQRLVGGHT